ncbi:MAG: hypothetical protein ACKVJE_20175 [Pseudomonadales bacterium]
MSRLSPSVDLYNRVSAGFVGQNSSLNKFCTGEGINRRSAESALKGMWNGPKGQKLRTQLIKASGIANNPISNAAGHTTPAAAAITTPEAFAYWGC